MKNIIISTVLVFCNLFLVFGQDKKSKIKALKTAFITEELSLTVKEAEKFWPIYNVFDEERFALHQEKKKLLSESENIENLSDADAEKFLMKLESLEDDFMKNRKKYVKSLLPVLGAKKLMMLKRAEDQFNRKLLKQFRGDKHESRRP
jgi:hypothetical protein